ncbi:MAG: MCE family protein [Pedosphaera sp.]|nr:MCE family protein [Pedosphaera sp.]
MDTSINPSRKVGLFVFFALVLIGLLLVNFSKGSALLSGNKRLVVRSSNVGGLKKGATVMMSGVQIGTVKRLNLASDGRSVLIDCRLQSRYHVHADARIEIEQSGFLGDQFVSIVPLKNEGGILQDGAEKTAESPFNLQEAARTALTLMSQLGSAATKIDAAVGRVDKLLLSDETLTNLTATIANFKLLSVRADHAVANIEAVVKTNSPVLGNTLSNFNAFSEGLRGLGDHLQTIGTDIASTITNVSSVVTNANGILDINKAEIRTAIISLRESADNLKAVTGEIQAGKGLAGAILKDAELKDHFSDLVLNLTTLTSNLTKYGLLYKPKAVKPASVDPLHKGRSGIR